MQNNFSNVRLFFLIRMHTPEGTLERGQVPPYTTHGYHQNITTTLCNEVPLPHGLSLPNLDESGNFEKRFVLLLVTLILLRLH